MPSVPARQLLKMLFLCSSVVNKCPELPLEPFPSPSWGGERRVVQRQRGGRGALGRCRGAGDVPRVASRARRGPWVALPARARPRPRVPTLLGCRARLGAPRAGLRHSSAARRPRGCALPRTPLGALSGLAHLAIGSSVGAVRGQPELGCGKALERSGDLREFLPLALQLLLAPVELPADFSRKFPPFPRV